MFCLPVCRVPPVFIYYLWTLFSFRITAPEETTFHLLHLSLMREYIDYEFSELRVRERSRHTRTHTMRIIMNSLMVLMDVFVPLKKDIFHVTGLYNIMFIFSESYWF